VRPRGQTLVALLVLAIVVAGGAVLQGAFGVRPPDGLAPNSIASGAWFCPHGGGKGWTATVFVANPGVTEVSARVRTLGEEKDASRQEAVRLAPGTSQAVEVEAGERGSSTVVEFFGGWAAAGWVARAAGGGGHEVGVAAEPCLPEAGRQWSLPDGDLENKGEFAYVVVMNPFAADAVFSVTTLTETDPPGGLDEWRNFVLRGGRSVAFELNEAALGHPTVAARVEASIGRVAAASLGVTRDLGVRSAVGHLGPPASSTILPGGGDFDTAELAVAVPGNEPASFGATLLGGKGLEPAGQLSEQLLDGAAASTFEVTTEDPSALVVEASGEGPGVVAVRRTRGVDRDLGATAGAHGAGSAWVVLPATGDEPQPRRGGGACPAHDTAGSRCGPGDRGDDDRTWVNEDGTQGAPRGESRRSRARGGGVRDVRSGGLLVLAGEAGAGGLRRVGRCPGARARLHQ
jgi:uncharacterized protein DUF5719